jgi:hypothetical protein
VKYYGNKKAWMTMIIFIFKGSGFLHGCVRQKKIVYNCAVHPKHTSFLRNVKVAYYPPDCILCVTLWSWVSLMFQTILEEAPVQKSV